MRERDPPALVIAAPPKTLADLRRWVPPEVKAKIVAEIDKDLTKHPVRDIERHIFEALKNE